MAWKDLAHGKPEQREAKAPATDKDDILGAKEVVARFSKKDGGGERGRYTLLFKADINGTPFAFYKAGDYKGVAMVAYGPVGQWIGRAKMVSFAGLTALLESADEVLAGLRQAVAKAK